MKILLATDGSASSAAAIREIQSRAWPPGTQVKVVTAVWTPIPAIPDPAMATYAARLYALEDARRQAAVITDRAVEALRLDPLLDVSSITPEGTPSEVIIEEARQWGADLVLLGAHGTGGTGQDSLGPVVEAVTLGAPCPVEIVRLDVQPDAAATGGTPAHDESMSTREVAGAAAGAAVGGAGAGALAAVVGAAFAGPLGAAVGGAVGAAAGVAAGAGIGLTLERAFVENEAEDWHTGGLQRPDEPESRESSTDGRPPSTDQRPLSTA